MRLGLSSILFVFVLAAAPHASAQAGVEGCAGDAVAMAGDGTPLQVQATGAHADADSDARHAPREFAWCREASDPRCQPMSPAPDQPSFQIPTESPSSLMPGFEFAAEPMVVFLARARPFQRVDRVGPSGISVGLDRPPQSR